jgi:hypothetical protein
MQGDTTKAKAAYQDFSNRVRLRSTSLCACFHIDDYVVNRDLEEDNRTQLDPATI